MDIDGIVTVLDVDPDAAAVTCHMASRLIAWDIATNRRPAVVAEEVGSADDVSNVVRLARTLCYGNGATMLSDEAARV